MKSVVVAAVFVALTGVLTACNGSIDQGASTVTVAQPSGAPDVPGEFPDAPGESSDESGTALPSVEPEAGTPASGAPANGGFTGVDASKFQIDGSYFFQSPTGNIMCGVLDKAPLGVGCQLRKAKFITPQLPNCTDAPDRKVATHLYEGKSELWCTSQGIFVGFPTDGKAGGKVLNYGESLSVNGYTCTSSTQGVRCVAGGHGFAISADNQHIF
ncbi:hypothetical protein ACFWUP_20235 [Nocardia sp. NPDC058658]|uniref:hypothetical protein n=1 Tax=Nocardia sp. NPDC058658 TaxID=3346580 RepID=UPI003657E2AC